MPKNLFLKILFTFFAFVVLFSLSQKTNAADWQSWPTDYEGDVGAYSSLAIDSNNNVHISYYDATNGDLKYATNSSGFWEDYTTIDSAGDVGKYTSIAIDSNNNVHISYYDATNGDLKYATNSSGSWDYSTLDSSSNVGQYTSLVLDSNNSVHISYYDVTNEDLKYATNSSGLWVLATLDNSNTVGEYTSIASDSNNKTHISYYDGTQRDLKYATNSSGSWVYSTVYDPGISGAAGQYSSIDLDSNNKAHISFYDAVGFRLLYATNSSGSWVTSVADSSSYMGQYTSLRLDSNNKAHISYCMCTGDPTLYYTTNTSGSWDKGTFNSGGGEFQTSLGLDSSGQVHISYYAGNNLGYASNAADADDAFTTVDSLSMAINSGAQYTTSQEVILSFSASGKVTQMKIYEGLDSGTWEPYSTSKSFTLSSGDGEKAVSVSAKNHWLIVGSQRSSGDTIILDTTAPQTQVSVPEGKYNTAHHYVKLSSDDGENGSGVDKIYYTLDGSKPTTTSNVYTPYKTYFDISRDTVLKFFAVDKAGNQESIKTARYTIKKAKFVTKSTKETAKYEIPINKENRKYYANDLEFLFKVFPSAFRKKRYYLEIERFKKYPLKYAGAEKLIFKKYWEIKTNLNRVKNEGYKLKLSFKYTNKEFKKLKKQNKSLKENNLVIKYYDTKKKKWKKINAKLSTKKNTFTTSFTKFSLPIMKFVIGKE